MAVAVCVYVNRTCRCGVHLNPRKVSTLPSQFGPGPTHRVLRDAVQACIDCANHERTVFNIIKDGHGKATVTGRYGALIRLANW